MSKTFTLSQVLDLLCTIEQALFPKAFQSSKYRTSEDFRNIHLEKAKELGIEEEFKKYMNDNVDYLEIY